MFYSQHKQDEYLEKNIFKGYQNGFFMDIGAHDGITINNTLYFEKNHNWSGINIEPVKSVYDKLIINRPNNININCSVSNNENIIMKTNMQSIKIDTKKIETICNDYNIKHINFLSIDVEGAEFDVLKSINFDNVFIDVIMFENNYMDKSIDIIKYIYNKNYILLKTSYDIIMINNNSIFNKKNIDFNTKSDYIEPFNIYYYNNDYKKPIYLIKLEENNKVYVNSSYWNDDYGIIVNNNKLKFINLGEGIANKNSISFGNNNIWHKDNRKNLLFIGANDMAEILNYVNKYNTGLFIEAIPDVYNKLKNNLINTKNYNTNYLPINKLVTSEVDKEYIFNIFNNNGCSSSIYEPNIKEWQWPNVKIIDKIKLTSTRIENILKENLWDDKIYDVILDVQGAELEVLKGFSKNNLNNIRTLQIEVSTKPFYEGGILFNEVNIFLINNNFILSKNPHINHCDVIYINSSFLK